jgi:hypothetical protein
LDSSAAAALCSCAHRGAVAVPQVTSIFERGLPWNMTPASNMNDSPLLMGRP